MARQRPAGPAEEPLNVHDPAPGERRAQADRRAESTRRMLRAAIALIASNGAKGATLAQIGEAAGYSRGLPAERFGSKLNLMSEVMDVTLVWLDRRLETALKDRTGLDAMRRRLAVHMESVRDSTEAATTLYHLMVEASAAMPELQPRVDELHATYRAGIRKDLDEAEAAGDLRPGVDKDWIARLLLGIMHGIVLQAFSDNRYDELPRQIAAACETVINDIAAPGRG